MSTMLLFVHFGEVILGSGGGRNGMILNGVVLYPPVLFMFCSAILIRHLTDRCRHSALRYVIEVSMAVKPVSLH